MDVVLGKAYFSWRGRTRFRSAFSLLFGFVRGKEEENKERKKTPLLVCHDVKVKEKRDREREREKERAGAEIALFLNLCFLFGSFLFVPLCMCSCSLCFLLCPLCRAIWFLCLFCLPWLCLSLCMHVSVSLLHAVLLFLLTFSSAYWQVFLARVLLFCKPEICVEGCMRVCEMKLDQVVSVVGACPCTLEAEHVASIDNKTSK